MTCHRWGRPTCKYPHVNAHTQRWDVTVRANQRPAADSALNHGQSEGISSNLQLCNSFCECSHKRPLLNDLWGSCDGCEIYWKWEAKWDWGRHKFCGQFAMCAVKPARGGSVGSNYSSLTALPPPSYKHGIADWRCIFKHLSINYRNWQAGLAILTEKYEKIEKNCPCQDESSSLKAFSAEESNPSRPVPGKWAPSTAITKPSHLSEMNHTLLAASRQELNVSCWATRWAALQVSTCRHKKLKFSRLQTALCLHQRQPLSLLIKTPTA